METNTGLDFLHVQRSSSEDSKGRHRAACDAARVYSLKKGEVVIHVQGKTMHCHPAFDSNTDGCEFSPVGPDPGTTRHSIGRNSEISCHTDEYFLQEAEVMTQILSPLTKAEDGIADQLARAMKGYISPPVGANHLDGWIQNVSVISAATDGIHREVLNQEDPLCELIPENCRNQLFLKRE